MLSPLIFRWGNQGDNKGRGAYVTQWLARGPPDQGHCRVCLSTACFSLSPACASASGQGHGTEQAAPVMPVRECFHSWGGTRHAEPVAAKTPTHVSRQQFLCAASVHPVYSVACQAHVHHCPCVWGHFICLRSYVHVSMCKTAGEYHGTWNRQCAPWGCLEPVYRPDSLLL